MRLRSLPIARIDHIWMDNTGTVREIQGMVRLMWLYLNGFVVNDDRVVGGTPKRRSKGLSNYAIAIIISFFMMIRS